MNDENKKLLSQNELTDIMYNYIKHKMPEMCLNDTHWKYESYRNYLYWASMDDKEVYHIIDADIFNNHWEINSDGRYDKYVRIKIFSDHVEFIEDSEFGYFNKEFMYGLYLKIKEVVEGNIDDNEPSELTDTTHESDSEQMNDENITEENETNNMKLFKINLVDYDGYRNDYIIYANSIDDAWNRFWKYIDTLDEYDDCGHFNIMDKSDYKKSDDWYGKYYGKNHVTDHRIKILIEEVYFNDNGLVHIKGPGSERWEDLL